jgi:DNA-binding NarL/FixJ family response regulator
MQPKLIRLMLVDDGKMIPKEVSALLNLNHDFELVAKASNRADTMLLCDKLHPDVVLINLASQSLDGTDLMESIREAYPDIQVVAESDFNNKEVMRMALQVSAVDHMLNTLRIDKAAEAIRSDAEYEPDLGARSDWSAFRSSLEIPDWSEEETQDTPVPPINNRFQ